MANTTGIEAAVAPPVEEAMLSYNRATPRDWQAFVRRVLIRGPRYQARRTAFAGQAVTASKDFCSGALATSLAAGSAEKHN